MKVFVLSQALPLKDKKIVGIYAKTELAEKTIRSAYPNIWKKDDWSGSYEIRFDNREWMLMFIDEVEVLEKHGLPSGKIL